MSSLLNKTNFKTVQLILVVGIFETFREYYRSGSRVISRPEKSRKFLNAFFDYYLDFKCLSFFTGERISYYYISLIKLIKFETLKIVIKKLESNSASNKVI
jgi:hypothetical protein